MGRRFGLTHAAGASLADTIVHSVAISRGVRITRLSDETYREALNAAKQELRRSEVHQKDGLSSERKSG